MSATYVDIGGAPAVVCPSGTAATQDISAYDAGFAQRLCFCGSLVALAVIVSASPPASQVSYARQFLSDPMTLVTRSVVWAVIADGVTNSGSTDQSICNRLGDLWPYLSTGY